MKQFLANHIKNINGIKVNRKIVAFAVDDYGNVRLANKTAKENLIKSGIKLKGRFDNLDSLDTREDYEMLFDVLSAVKDKLGNPAIFTPYALVCNTDYEKTKENNFYIPENLDITYDKISADDKAFEGTYQLLLEGIAQKFIKPQFHGREHLNINLFNALFKDKNSHLIANLNYKSLAGIPKHHSYPNIDFNQAFAFCKKDEIELHKNIIEDGLKRFEQVYCYKSATFTPPAQRLHPDLYEFVGNFGVKGVDKGRATLIHLGDGVYIREKNILGEKSSNNSTTIVRNCLFEPNDRNIDWVNFTFKQIEAAFFWNKPAIISSHRVNFCGHINPVNRNKSLDILKTLLKKIIKTWPDVEFLSIDELIKLYENDK